MSRTVHHTRSWRDSTRQAVHKMAQLLKSASALSSVSTFCFFESSATTSASFTLVFNGTSKAFYETWSRFFTPETSRRASAFSLSASYDAATKEGSSCDLWSNLFDDNDFLFSCVQRKSSASSSSSSAFLFSALLLLLLSVASSQLFLLPLPPSARSFSKAPHRTRESRGSYLALSLLALSLVSFSRSFSEEAREHRLEYKWDRRFLSFCSIEQCQESANSVLPLPPNDSAESRGFVK